MRLVIDPHILRSLHRSELRKKILFYLHEIYPSSTYLSEIARIVRSDPSNVKGALVGMGNRYNGDSSLVYLGLVEEINHNGFRYYKLTEHGKKVVEFLKTYQSYYSRFM
ncbi:transcriptional regulator [Thermococcus argininiproducens]|uniref:Transcriptional regulator n=1 Tax=Thermococcus argininiproducens TaxID=2866384 RepID=A0A9E7SBX5_9EURY|nr:MULTISPECIES: archaellum operon transcriptional activator EarA family protein [Thermococcus]KPU62862.1 transcriptional regulator [Thermococcus sp. EP1]USG99304.1 transcriptional regulator [Thermococcus argininiproducens]